MHRTVSRMPSAHASANRPWNSLSVNARTIHNEASIEHLKFSCIF